MGLQGLARMGEQEQPRMTRLGPWWDALFTCSEKAGGENLRARPADGLYTVRVPFSTS